MAPEQLRSARDIDQRADIWGFGAVLYELFAGRPAFAGDSVAEVCASVLTERPVPLVRVRPEVGPALSRVVERCLAFNREARFQSMADVARALRDATRPAPAVRAPLPSVDLDDDEIGPIPGVRRHRFLSVFLTIVACLALLLAVALATLGPARTLELGRQFAVSALLGGAREHRVPQLEVARASRVGVTKPASPIVSPNELPELEPVPRAAPRPKRAKAAATKPAAAPERAEPPAEASSSEPSPGAESSAPPESPAVPSAIASAENTVVPEGSSAE